MLLLVVKLPTVLSEIDMFVEGVPEKITHSNLTVLLFEPPMLIEPIILFSILPVPLWSIPLFIILSVVPLKVNVIFPFEVVLPNVLPADVPTLTSPLWISIPAKYTAADVEGVDVKARFPIILPLTFEADDVPAVPNLIKYK